MAVVTLGEIIAASTSASSLGLDPVTERQKIIYYIQRALELQKAKGNWTPYMGTIDVMSDCAGNVVLPSFVEDVMALNVAGRPALFQSAWFQFHINGPGSGGSGPIDGWPGGPGYSLGGGLGAGLQFTWQDNEFVSTFQPLPDWRMLAAICEDPADAGLQLEVRGITGDGLGNTKQALTQLGPNAPLNAVVIPLAANLATTDQSATQFRQITSVYKPVTRGYVKLLGISGAQGEQATVIGYYAPNETTPRYRRIVVNAQCAWVRCRFRRTTFQLQYDHEEIPIASVQAMMFLLQAIRYYDAGDLDRGTKYEAMATQLIMEAQSMTDGPGNWQLSVDPGFCAGTLDFR